MSGILRQLKNTLANTGYKIDTKIEAELWNALSEAIDQIEKLGKVVGHRDRCSMLEWSDEAQHVPTKWGFVITADKCSCGAIKTITDLLS